MALADGGGAVEEDLKPVEEDRDILRPQPHDRHLHPLPVHELRFGRPHVVAELVERLRA